MTYSNHILVISPAIISSSTTVSLFLYNNNNDNNKEKQLGVQINIKIVKIYYEDYYLNLDLFIYYTWSLLHNINISEYKKKWNLNIKS